VRIAGRVGSDCPLIPRGALGPGRRIDDAKRSLFNNGVNAMSKSPDAKKNVKKAPSKTPKEKKEAKRLKKAERKH
jgi:hypothetical protein